MMNTSTIAVDLVAAGGVLDDLIADTSLPISMRNKLTAYKTKLASKNTKKTEDLIFLGFFEYWIRKQKITA
jgi:hypothetical protein